MALPLRIPKEHAMDKAQAIRSLSAEIELSDTDLYYFQPKDQKEKFFIGEVAITAAATVLLTAFLSGLESSLQPRIKKWGDTLGTWISDQLESLFKPVPPAVDDELERRIATVRNLVAAASTEERAQVAEEVEKLIQDTLSKRGVPQDRAAAIAASTRQSAMGLATGT